MSFNYRLYAPYPKFNYEAFLFSVLAELYLTFTVSDAHNQNKKTENKNMVAVQHLITVYRLMMPWGVSSTGFTLFLSLSLGPSSCSILFSVF